MFQDKPHFDFGIVPGDGVNLLWPEVIGSIRVRHFILTRQILDAQTAKDWGVVYEIVPADKLLARAHEIADQIAALPVLTSRYTRIALTQKLRRRSVRENQVEFPILSDPENKTAEAFGLRFALPDYLVELYKSLKNDLPSFNGDASWTLPMPARFVIGQDSIIRYAEVNPDYTRRPEPMDMLPFIKISQREGGGTMLKYSAPAPKGRAKSAPPGY